VTSLSIPDNVDRVECPLPPFVLDLFGDDLRSWLPSRRFSCVPISWLSLSLLQLRVAIALAHFADDAGEAWPNIDTIARVSGVPRRHLWRVLRDLETAGVIARRDAAKRRSMTYWLSSNAGCTEIVHPSARNTCTVEPAQISASTSTDSGAELHRFSAPNIPGEHTKRIDHGARPRAVTSISSRRNESDQRFWCQIVALPIEDRVAARELAAELCAAPDRRLQEKNVQIVAAKCAAGIGRLDIVGVLSNACRFETALPPLRQLIHHNQSHVS